jgi:hypothetical protein
MSESKWLACTDPTPMLEYLRGKVSDRKLRLFGCGCCRRLWGTFVPASWSAVEASEWYADRPKYATVLHEGSPLYGSKPDEEAVAATTGQAALFMNGGKPDIKRMLSSLQSAAGYVAVHSEASLADPRHSAVMFAARNAEGAAQAALLRDVLGNPFRPVTVSPAWQTPQVVALAQAAYDQRELPAGTLDTTRLAVLADALEEAGCEQADILNHCREPGVHVRGCWAVDLLLGKE